jgi:hypothetical protein
VAWLDFLRAPIASMTRGGAVATRCCSPSRLVQCAMCAHGEGEGELVGGVGAVQGYIAALIRRTWRAGDAGPRRITAVLIAGRQPLEPQPCLLILNHGLARHGPWALLNLSRPPDGRIVRTSLVPQRPRFKYTQAIPRERRLPSRRSLLFARCLLCCSTERVVLLAVSTLLRVHRYFAVASDKHAAHVPCRPRRYGRRRVRPNLCQVREHERAAPTT